jgi:hypothetical protein
VYRGERTTREYPANGEISSVVVDDGKREEKTVGVQDPAAMMRFVQGIVDSCFVERLMIRAPVRVPLLSVRMMSVMSE